MNKIINWFIRLSTIYLFLWWSLVYLSFSSNVTVGSLPFFEYLKTLIIFFLPHSVLLLSTISKYSRLQFLFFIINVFCLLFYLHLLQGKIIYTIALGAIAYILSISLFIKNWRRKLC